MRKLSLLLAFVMLFGLLQAPLLTTAQAADPWNLLDSSLGADYSTDWKVVQGAAGGTVTQNQEGGYVNISKPNEAPAEENNQGAYTWLTPKTAIALPTDQPFTAEATLRIAGPTTYRAGQVSARLSNKLYPVFVSYGTEDGWIATTSGGGTNKVSLDTTTWHNYGLVVDPAAGTYDVYVDGTKVISGAEAQAYSGGTLFRIGVDSDARTNMDVKAARVGTGDLSANLSKEYAPAEPEPTENWDLLDHDFAPQWDSEGFRTSSKVGTVTQKEGYVNIQKPNDAATGSEKLYHWVCSPAGLKLPRDGYTLETAVRVASPVNGEANEISIRMGEHSEDTNGKIAAVFLGYGEKGYISANANGAGPYCVELNTTVWHKLSYVVFQMNGGYYYDLYVDDALVFDSVPFQTYKGADLVRFGADNGGRCDLDVQYVRLGTGPILPEGASSARITGISLSQNTQKETEEQTVTVTLEAPDFEDGRAVTVSLLDKNRVPVEGISASGSFSGGTAEVPLTIPAKMKAKNYYVYGVSECRTATSEA